MKKNRFIVPALFFSLLIFTFTVSDAFAQNNNKGEKNNEKNNEIVLFINALENGYKLLKKKNKIYVQAINVIDPLTKKRLDGETEVKFRCKEPDPIQRLMDVVFKNGSTPKPLLIICEDVEAEALATLVVNKLR